MMVQSVIDMNDVDKTYEEARFTMCPSAKAIRLESFDSNQSNSYMNCCDRTFCIIDCPTFNPLEPENKWMNEYVFQVYLKVYNGDVACSAYFLFGFADKDLRQQFYERLTATLDSWHNLQGLQAELALTVGG